jgi:hypothetical protein
MTLNAYLKKIIISRSEWKERIFNFDYSPFDENVEIKGDKIKIDFITPLVHYTRFR